MITAPLFQREKVSLDGYVPKFNEQEVLLGYRTNTYQVSGRGAFRGFGCMVEDDDEPAYQTDHYITLAGHEITGPVGYVNGANDAVVKLANWFFSYKPFKEKYPQAWQFLSANSKDLSESNRYWAVIRQQREIEKKKAELAKMQLAVTAAEWIAQVNIYEVLEGRKLSETERERVYVEFTGTAHVPVQVQDL